MRRHLAGAAIAVMSLIAGPAVADNASAELITSWSGSPGTGISLGLTGRYIYVDGLTYSTRGYEGCDCFSVSGVNGGGYNDETGRGWYASWDGRLFTIAGYDISFGGSTETEFAIPAGGTLNLTMAFQALHGDNSFSFTDPNGVTTALASGDTLSYSFTNTTSDVAFEWTSLSLNMAGTIPEPSEGVLMLLGGFLLALVRSRRLADRNRF